MTFACGYKRILGLLQVGRSTRYLAIIETPVAYTVGTYIHSLTRVTSVILRIYIYDNLNGRPTLT